MKLDEANSTTLEKESEKLQPELKKRVLTAAQQKLHNFKTGQEGETDACRYLQECGYHIIERNLVIGTNEVDIIALDKKQNELVFIEVKKRSNSKFGNPSLAVNKKKIHGLSCAARGYMRKYPSQLDYRFDIIAVTGKKIEHFENVSWNL